MDHKSFMVHEDTVAERIDRRFDRLKKAIETCTCADVVDSAFYLGEDSKVFTNEQFDKLESLYRLFHEGCECRKTQKKGNKY